MVEVHRGVRTGRGRVEQPVSARRRERVFAGVLLGLGSSSLSTDSAATSSSPRAARANATEPSSRSAWWSITRVAYWSRSSAVVGRKSR